jgi:hypothetical protein
MLEATENPARLPALAPSLVIFCRARLFISFALIIAVQSTLGLVTWPKLTSGASERPRAVPVA